MTTSALTRARAGDEQAFRDLTESYRRELQVHCYRILGSVQDAEDALQETLLSAWRGLDGYEERASMRAWLYKIATNRCLNVLRDSSRRPEERRPLTFEPPEPTRHGEFLWLEPYPDAMLEGVPDAAPGPDVRYETHETIALAFVTALQRLVPRQRAALVLRDVLGFRASEVATMLDTTEVSVNSALQRARATLDATAPPRRDRAPLPSSSTERELVAQFADAFQNGRVEQIVALLTDDAWVTMPPEPFEYQGLAAIDEFFTQAFRARPRDRTDRLVPTRANGQPAFGHYIGDMHAPVVRGVGVIVMTIEGDRVSQLTRFGGAALLARFGLARTLPR
ncbi:MAG TPA: sigma-70 family RNA polymerase sigma factor [Solirubrobacteraceae bacterium]|nr:sigma-70 family RNA polymerase sigma factor [Solirubrobacteraceae bacterium]